MADEVKNPKKEKIASVKRPSWRAILIAGLAALLLAVCFSVLFYSVRQQIRQSNIAAMEELATHDERSIQTSVTLRWEIMEGIRDRAADREWQSTKELILALQDLLSNLPSCEEIVLLDSEGTEYCSNGIVRKSSYITNLIEGETTRFAMRDNTTTYFIENTHETLLLAIPVDFDVCGHQMQWMLCRFPISTLEDELKISSYSNSGFSSVIDFEGNYIINISRTHNFGAYDNFFDDLDQATLTGYSDVNALRDALLTSSETISMIYTINGQEKIMVITAISFADWFFITSVPLSVFDTQANAILRVFLILFAVIALVTICIFIILTRQRKAQERLRISEAASEAKTKFLFSMSHDIRTPMNAILGYTNIALRHAGDAQQAKLNLDKIRLAGDHLLNLINDILEMSRIESGKMALQSDPVDIRKATQTVVQMNEALTTAKSIDFSVDAESIQNPYVYADELHVNEVVINLLSNAVKYTPEGGRIHYTVRQISGVKDGKARYLFRVEDNGIGMSEEFQTHLFEAFSREQSASVSKIEGAGLGLSIVKRIVDLAGGTIHVKSKSGEGSAFTVEMSFPVMNDEEIKAYEASHRPVSLANPDEKLRGKRVLLVEDNEMNREIAAEILTEAGLVTETAEDGEIAVKCVMEKGIEYFDCILMDIQMPVMNGYEATRAIRMLQDGGRIPIIALSANAFAEDKEASVRAGMNGHVAKPINIKELLGEMGRFM